MAFLLKFYQVTCEYRFKPNLGFYPQMHQIGLLFSEEYKHWETSGLKLTLMNPADRSSLLIEHNRLAAAIDVPSNAEILESRFNRAFKEYQRNVQIKHFRRLGVRSISMVGLEFDFEETVDVMQAKLLPRDKMLTEIVGETVKDFMYNVITEKDGKTVHVVCGPVQKKEISKWYNPTRMVTDSDEEVKEIVYPNVSLFIDCDCYTTEPTAKMAETFYQSGLKMVTSIPAELVKHILEN
jgi:ferredoxin-thioredoxin reductase catalytic subunit